jgi:thiol-disulfide isomerase/thioredoxin
VGSRLGGTANHAQSQSQSNAIVVVGDQPLLASAGEPIGKVVADAEEPEPKLNPKRRISGRVVDEAGKAVAGATVRLADGGVKGGKEIVGTTDRTGAFTLNGLRPGSSYVLIAESEDEKGPIRGRIEASTADTGVEIALTADDKKPTTRRTSAKPAKAKPVSNREDVGDGDEAPRVNREDVAPPADEANAVDPGPPQPTRGGRPQLSPPEPGVGWKNSRNATASRPQHDDAEADSASSDAPVKRRRPAKAQAPVEPDDETNPLPPAIDPDAPDEAGSSRSGSARSNSASKVGANSPRKATESGEIALVPEASLDEKADRAKTFASGIGMLSTLQPDPDQPPTIPPPTVQVAEAEKPAPSAETGPPPLPPIGGEAVQVAIHEAPSPTTSPPPTPTAPQDVAPPKPASQPVFASNVPPASKPVEAPASPADYNPFANLPTAKFPPDRVVENPPIVRPTSAEVEPAPSVVEAPKQKWGELAASDRPPGDRPAPVVQPAKVTLTGALFRRIKPPAEPKEPSIAACVYDSKNLKINELRLPDLEGKPVRFQDLDADFVLLDFWGTWCEPCLDSIPHLVELQKKYGPGKLKVVGIACEEGTPEQRRAKVDQVSRKYGINYPILLSTLDGKPCPVQQALQVQAMPTMILVDRKGQVRWRNAGSTPASESRLDRILADNISRSGSARR